MALRLAAQDNQDHTHKLPHYTLTVLPTLGGTFGHAAGINNTGSVTGFSTLAGDLLADAFLWQKGAITNLGNLGADSAGVAINDRGTVSGYSNTSTPDPNGEDVCGFGNILICLPFVWQKGVMTPLPLLGGNNGQAIGINNRGQIVGGAETHNPDTCSIFFLQAEAALWENGQVQELPPFPGDPDGFANAINDKGQTVGVTGCAATNTVRAVLWPKGPNGGVIDLGNLGGTGGNVPSEINNQGQVVGQSDLPGDTTHHAFLWTKEDGMQDLGTLNGQPVSLAFGINNKGQVVGIFEDFAGDNTTGFLWQDGVMTDLNTLIPPGSPLFLKEPVGINDRGQIVGFGLLADGEQRGFLLDPCDEERGNGDCGENVASAAIPTRADSVLATQHPAALTPSSRLPVGMLNRLRFPWSQRNLGSGIGPASDQKQESPADTVSSDWLADHSLTPRCWPYCRSGYCEADFNGRLTGNCVGHKFQFCDIQPSTNCPRGKRARKVTLESCGVGFPDRVDPTRKCSF
jgi:probable HAF family extracellular repeat protein